MLPWKKIWCEIRFKDSLFFLLWNLTSFCYECVCVQCTMTHSRSASVNRKADATYCFVHYTFQIIAAVQCWPCELSERKTHKVQFLSSQVCKVKFTFIYLNFETILQEILRDLYQIALKGPYHTDFHDLIFIYGVFLNPCNVLFWKPPPH